MCLTLYLTKNRSVEPHVFVGLHDMYFKDLNPLAIEEVARMYLALSGWLSIFVVVALAAWQEDSEQRDGETRMQREPYAEVHPLDQVDDEAGNHS